MTNLHINKFRLMAIVLFVATAAINRLYAQHYTIEQSALNIRYERIDDQYGFVQNSIHGIYQDHRGYIYYGTPNGVFRYDGYEFDRRSTVVGDLHSLAYNFVLDIDSDGGDDVWFLNFHSLNRYNINDGLFYRYRLPEFRNVNCISVVVDRKDSNKLWVLTQSNVGCITLDPITLEMASVSYPIIAEGQTQDRRVTNIAPCSEGGVFIICGGGIQHIDLDEGGGLVESNIYVDKFHTDICGGDDGYLYAATRRGVKLLRLTTEGDVVFVKSLLKFDFSDLDRVAIRRSKSGDLVVIINGYGIIHVDLNSGSDKAEYYPIMVDNPDFEVSMFGDALIDESGVLWLGTFYTGLFKINLHQKRFSSLEALSQGEAPNYRYFANAITGDNRGNIWIGSHQRGLMKVREEGGRIVNYENVSTLYKIPKRASVHMVTYASGYLWVSLRDRVFRYEVDERGELIAARNVPLNNCAVDNVVCSYLDSDGVLWMGNFSSYHKGGLYYIDTTKGAQAEVRELKLPRGISNNNISAIMRDSRGALWFSTINSGIYRAILDGDRVAEVERLRFDDDMREVDVNNSMCIHEDASHNVWIGLFGGGFIKLKVDHFETPSTIEHYTTEDGLADDGVYSIISDSKGIMWISSDGGVTRFNPQTKSFRNYNRADGVNNLNFRKWSAWQDSRGYIYFGGTNGVTRFLPEQICDNLFAPKVNITRVESSQKELDIYSNQRLRLKAGDNSLNFRFSAIHLDNPRQITYYYRLIGQDEGWVRCSAENRYAAYSYLAPGSYTFEVQAVTRDGVWSTATPSIDIYLTPYWYQRWWARLLALIVLFIITYIWRRVARNRRELKQQIAQEAMISENLRVLNQAKLDFYTNISHEIKTPLTIMSGVANNAIRSGVESIEKRDFQIICRNISRMLQLVTQLLDFRRAASGHLPFNPLRSDIVSFMYEMMSTYEGYLEGQGFRFRFTPQQDSLELDFDPDKIQKIMSNLISNAVKYSDQRREIEIDLKRGLPSDMPQKYAHAADDEYVTISVRDRGIGISSEEIESIFNRFFQASSDLNLTDTNKGVGVGLSYVKILVDLHNGYVFARSIPNEGSIFYVILPLVQPNVEVAMREANEVILTQAVEEMRESIASEEGVASAEMTPDTIRPNISDYEILIVEDNSEIRHFVKEFLSTHYKIYEAENGEEGLRMAIELIPDIIITDVMMPLMDGVEMTSRVKNDPKSCHIPIIMLTVNDHIENRIDGLKAGADSYITKPFNVEHLLTRIEKLLELRNTLKSKYLNISGDVNFADTESNEADRDFVEQFERILEDHLSDSEFTVNEIESIMGYSRMQFYRKMKSVIGVPFVEYVRNYKLKRSVDMMHTTNKQIREILYDVGFTSPSYYSKCFKARYGKTPREFLQNIRK